jgi:hypothetical protein
MLLSLGPLGGETYDCSLRLEAFSHSSPVKSPLLCWYFRHTPALRAYVLLET